VKSASNADVDSASRIALEPVPSSEAVSIAAQSSAEIRNDVASAHSQSPLSSLSDVVGSNTEDKQVSAESSAQSAADESGSVNFKDQSSTEVSHSDVISDVSSSGTLAGSDTDSDSIRSVS